MSDISYSPIILYFLILLLFFITRRQPKQECADIDECSVNNGDCARHSGCFNTIGSFHCGECDAGYDGNQRIGCWPSFCPAN